MVNTYTYTARSIEHPEQVVTFTLQDHHMSVGLGAPLEQIETVLQQPDLDDEVGEKAGQEGLARPWIKPLAVSLLERGVGPFRVADVSAEAVDDSLRISAWYRAGGLALAPVTLVDGRVDNPPAAQAFAAELNERKSEAADATGFLKVLDYWFTWILAGVFLVGLFTAWRRRGGA